MMMTVGEVAERLAEATHLEAPSIARLLRSWLQQGVLVPTSRVPRGVGQIVAAYFDNEGLARARMLLALAAFGSSLTGAAMRDAVRDESKTPVEVFPNGRHVHYGLSSAVADTEAGSPAEWTFEVGVFRSLEDGSPVAVTQWLLNGRPASGFDALANTYLEVRAQIPASLLLRQLFSEPAA